MENILEPTIDYDFSKLYLGPPSSLQGGAYFTRIMHGNNKQLFIQTPKSLSKQGFIKSGKKIYIDLMFESNDTVFVNWIENLETRCQDLLFSKSEQWFQTALEKSDIESAFTSTLKIFKSGKYYLLRVNVKPNVKIYNETDEIVLMDNVISDTDMISILEIQGIKFTSRNFQIEIELKQVMVLDNEPIFENCLIKTNKKSMDHKLLDELNDVKLQENIEPLSVLETASNSIIPSIVEEANPNNESNVETKLEEMNAMIDTLEEFDPVELLQSNEDKKEDANVDIDFEDLSDDIEENNNTLREINNNDLNLDKSETSITLKKPNQVYFELYKEARNKAKQAKKSAILAYLEAKNIKKTYMIENINDSDSDFDAEIDEASESELEGL